MAKNTKKAPRAGSIARRINASFFSSLFSVFIILDCIILIFDFFPLLENFRTGVVSESEFYELFIAGIYRPRYIVIASAEVFFLLLRLIFGSGKIRRSLRPLDEIASAAISFSGKSSGIDEEMFRRLESAIDSISPDSDTPRIHTGEKELAGLELAVNNLVERMYDSYLQQARFVSDASHELRTPIAVIKGYADMLDRWGKSDEKILEESIDAIKSESEHMNYLVEQLLFLARGDTGRAKMEFSSFDLAALLKDVCDEYAMINSSHSFVFSAPGAVPAYGDASMLKQAARILIDNAIKYTPAGGSIAVKAASAEGSAVFSVQDSGIGIGEASLPHIFERFYRADSSRARDTGGTGLGLSIAKWIIDKHRGTFSVISREEIGTRITVSFPASAPTK